MAMVQGKSLKYRVWASHIALCTFLALIIFPLLMIVAISFREGNFATGSIIPDNPSLEHWKPICNTTASFFNTETPLWNTEDFLRTLQ